VAVSDIAGIILLPVWRDAAGVVEQVATHERRSADVRMASIQRRDVTG
jgi:hypothetical protein